MYEYPVMKYFDYKHLPTELQYVSKEFYELACSMANTLRQGAETAVCLRKLLEAKDAAVRASLDDQ